MVALGVDLAASGGKAVAGAFDGAWLAVREVCRFANEGGAGGRYRLLRDVAGLWPAEECWRGGGSPACTSAVAAAATGC